MITPMQKYHNARQSAQNRNIDWQFTFETWMAWWGDDFELRGNKSSDLCMARNGDVGAYHPTNVRKATVAENIKEMRARCKSPRLGKTHTQASKEKIRLKHIGMRYSDEVNAKKGIKSTKTNKDMKV